MCIFEEVELMKFMVVVVYVIIVEGFFEKVVILGVIIMDDFVWWFCEKVVLFKLDIWFYLLVFIQCSDEKVFDYESSFIVGYGI